jgi:hypothetical protein
MKRLLLIIAALAWIFIVVFNYYIVHKPFTVANVLAMGDGLANVFVWLALMAAAVGAGGRILRGFEFAPGLEGLVFRAGLGFGLLGVATFALGLVGLLHPLVFWVLLLGALVLLRKEIRDNARGILDTRGFIETRGEKMLGVFAGLTILIAFLQTLTPTIAWDAQVYHLVAGKIALARGFIGAPPDNPTLSYPALVEMLYLAALALKGDGPTPLIHFGFALLTLAGLFAFSARYFSAQVRWRAVAILCAVPSFILVATWPYNDIALAFYSFAAFYAVTVAKERGEVRWFALTGVFAGFALGEKYTAVAVPIALFVLIARPNRAALKNAMVMAVVAALVAAPWSIRNVVFTGNPVYPFIFGGPYWDAYRAAHFTPPSEMLVQPWRLVIAPWEATILGVQGTTSFDTTIGPLLLMLLPLLALVWKRGERVVNDALIFSGVLYLFWQYRKTRF